MPLGVLLLCGFGGEPAQRGKREKRGLGLRNGFLVFWGVWDFLRSY